MEVTSNEVVEALHDSKAITRVQTDRRISGSSLTGSLTLTLPEVAMSIIISGRLNHVYDSLILACFYVHELDNRGHFHRVWISMKENFVRQ